MADDFNLTMFSLVSRCPYCGAAFGQPGLTNDGRPCTHPTKMESAHGFVAAAGERQRYREKEKKHNVERT